MFAVKTTVVAGAVSAVLHGALAAWLVVRAPEAAQARTRQPVEVEVRAARPRAEVRPPTVTATVVVPPAGRAKAIERQAPRRARHRSVMREAPKLQPDPARREEQKSMEERANPIMESDRIPSIDPDRNPSDQAVVLPAGGADTMEAAGAPLSSGASPASAHDVPAGAGDGSLAADEVRRAWTARHLGAIRDAIQRRMSYPPSARRMGWTGRVMLRFRVLPSGAVTEVRIETSSGFPALDQSAIASVERAAPFAAPPSPIELLAPVVFELED